jgi:hypothetical protein
MAINYRAALGRYTLDIPHKIITLAAICEWFWPRRMDAVALFDVFPGEETQADRTVLLAAAEAFLQWLEADAGLLKQTKGCDLQGQLRGLLDFLRSQADPTIIKTWDDGKVSLQEIIAGYKEGVVDETWLRTHLRRLGKRGRTQLNRGRSRATDDPDKMVYEYLLRLLGE